MRVHIYRISVYIVYVVLYAVLFVWDIYVVFAGLHGL